jgi:hypothetical protein
MDETGPLKRRAGLAVIPGEARNPSSREMEEKRDFSLPRTPFEMIAVRSGQTGTFRQ